MRTFQKWMKSLIAPKRSLWASIRIGYTSCIVQSTYEALIQRSWIWELMLIAGEAMAGFPCWEPLEKQFSVATELGPDHNGDHHKPGQGWTDTSFQVTWPLLTPPTSCTTTAWTTWLVTAPGWCSSPPWRARTMSTPAGFRATQGTAPSSSPSTPTTSVWSSSGTWSGRQTPRPSSVSQPFSSRWVGHLVSSCFAMIFFISAAAVNDSFGHSCLWFIFPISLQLCSQCCMRLALGCSQIKFKHCLLHVVSKYIGKVLF